VAILVVISNLVKNDDTGTIILCIVFALYSVAGFLFARRLFLSAQDVQWTGGTISIPAWLEFGGQTVSSVRRPRRALFALVRKEFQLHQVSILLAMLLAVLDLIWIVLLKIRPSLFSDRFAGEIMILGFFGLFWFAIPWLIGSLAVAEERRLGTLEVQLCMPVTRRVQLFVKFVVALILTVFLGALLPWCLVRIASLIGVNAEIFRRGLFENELATRTIACAALVAISFYASTLARSTLQTMGFAVVLTAVVWLIIVGLFGGYYLRAWTTANIFLIGFPIMLTVLIWLTYTNYKRLLEGWKTWFRNFITLTASLISVVVVAYAIYYRVWELVLPLEPRHGPPRLSPSQQVTLQASDRTIAVHLPDGRVWLDPVGYRTNTLLKLLNENYEAWQDWPVSLNQEYFVNGSNWTAIASSWWLLVGIQNDGTLCCLRKPYTNTISQPLRIGAEMNWQQVAPSSPGFMLLKKDGSLWGWGTNDSSFYRTNFQAALAAPPYRIGSDSDWAEIIPCGWRACARKKDGSLWEWTHFWNKDNKKNEFLFRRRPDLDHNEWLNLSPEEPLGVTNTLCAGVRSDGTLWLWVYSDSKDHPDEIVPNQKIQFGKERHWQTVFISGSALVAVERNGTMWEWVPIWEWIPTSGSAFGHHVIAEPAPAQLGSNSDWITISPLWPGVLSLAADGSIWRWNGGPYNPLLGPSRRPEKVADIFSGSP
jgi:alpha-tubulin suppressor-like RCC1 family protein